MCIVEFHKDLIPSGPSADGMTTLWDDIVHVVDLTRYLCGGRIEAVHAYRDSPFTNWPSCYNAMVRYDNGSTAIISGNRTSGGRFLRAEMHGREIGAYMDDLPGSVRFMEDNSAQVLIKGSELSGSTDDMTFDGMLEMHRHFLACARDNKPATSSFDDAVETMRLVAQIEQGKSVTREFAGVAE